MDFLKKDMESSKNEMKLMVEKIENMIEVRFKEQADSQQEKGQALIDLLQTRADETQTMVIDK